MEQIQPILWNPVTPEATQLSVWNTDDNLSNQCLFGWQLLTETGSLVDRGTVPCTGNDYVDWDGNRQFPYTYTAKALGVTLL
jgi:hypothetical protein